MSEEIENLKNQIASLQATNEAWVKTAGELRQREEKLREAIRIVVGQFEALKEHQENLLVRGQDFESASKNWEEAATMGPGINFDILKEALKETSQEAKEG